MSRDIDREFAEKVLGINLILCDCKRRTPMLPATESRHHYCCTTPGGEPGLGRLPRYSRSLDAAWSNDKMAEMGVRTVTFNPGTGSVVLVLPKGQYVSVFGDHPAEALVRALLAAKDSNA